MLKNSPPLLRNNSKRHGNGKNAPTAIPLAVPTACTYFYPCDVTRSPRDGLLFEHPVEAASCAVFVFCCFTYQCFQLQSGQIRSRIRKFNARAPTQSEFGMCVSIALTHKAHQIRVGELGGSQVPHSPPPRRGGGAQTPRPLSIEPWCPAVHTCPPIRSVRATAPPGPASSTTVLLSLVRCVSTGASGFRRTHLRWLCALPPDQPNHAAALNDFFGCRHCVCTNTTAAHTPQFDLPGFLSRHVGFSATRPPTRFRISTRIEGTSVLPRISTRIIFPHLLHGVVAEGGGASPLLSHPPPPHCLRAPLRALLPYTIPRPLEG